jgi:ubiquinone/menaquinone biosynthesis C-methylase UbiE
MSNLQIVTEAFSELASDYRQTMDRELKEFWGISYQEFITRFLEQAALSPTDLVLDVATGTAFIPTQLVEKFGRLGRVVGLDLTPAMLNKGQEYVARQGLQPSIWLVCASGMEMPFLSHVFDVVLCALGTHHMDVPTMLDEVNRVLKPGGRLLIADVGATPFWRSFWGLAVLNILLLQYRLANRGARAQAEAKAFANVRTASEWKGLLTNQGFQEIEIEAVPSRRPWYPCGLMIRGRRSDLPVR